MNEYSYRLKPALQQELADALLKDGVRSALDVIESESRPVRRASFAPGAPWDTQIAHEHQFKAGIAHAVAKLRDLINPPPPPSKMESEEEAFMHNLPEGMKAALKAMKKKDGTYNYD